MATAVVFPRNDNQKVKAPGRKEFMTGMGCLRCGGLLVIEPCLDFQVQRCVQCGDIVDPVIVQNRQHPLTLKRKASTLSEPKKAA